MEAVHALIEFNNFLEIYIFAEQVQGFFHQSAIFFLTGQFEGQNRVILFLLLFMQPQWGVTAVCLMNAFAAVDIQELLVRLVTVSL